MVILCMKFCTAAVVLAAEAVVVAIVIEFNNGDAASAEVELAVVEYELALAHQNMLPIMASMMTPEIT